MDTDMTGSAIVGKVGIWIFQRLQTGSDFISKDLHPVSNNLVPDHPDLDYGLTDLDTLLDMLDSPRTPLYASLPTASPPLLSLQSHLISSHLHLCSSQLWPLHCSKRSDTATTTGSRENPTSTPGPCCAPVSPLRSLPAYPLQRRLLPTLPIASLPPPA